MTHPETFITSLLPSLERAAKRLSRAWPGIEADDIQQEMSLKVVENFETIKNHPNLRSIALGLAEKAGVAYCSGERYFYQANSAEWIYTPKEVREVLAEHYFNTLSWHDAPKRRDPDQRLLGDGISIALMDIDNAVNALSEKDQALIFRVFDAGEVVKDRKAVTRVVDKITTFLNRGISQRFDHSDHDGPGSRESLTNTQARHALD